MTVSLISYSKPNDCDKSLQDLVAYCARVSNPANQNNTETNEKLIRYLIKKNYYRKYMMILLKN